MTHGGQVRLVETSPHPYFGVVCDQGRKSSYTCAAHGPSGTWPAFSMTGAPSCMMSLHFIPAGVSGQLSTMNCVSVICEEEKLATVTTKVSASLPRTKAATRLLFEKSKRMKEVSLTPSARERFRRSIRRTTQSKILDRQGSLLWKARKKMKKLDNYLTNYLGSRQT